MSFRVRLPVPPGHDLEPVRLDLLDGASSAVQRQVRRVGIGGYETPTMATLLAVAAQQRAPVFFDVGANVGLYAAMVARLLTASTVVAFEPTPSTAAIARQIVAANGLDVRVEAVALGADEGTADLYLSAKSDASNSLVEGFKRSTGMVTVPVRRLDGYVEASRLVPTLLKVDTETFEPQVIAGAVETLRRHRPTMVVEVLKRRGHDHGVELTEAMAGLGYHYHRIDEDLALVPSSTIPGNDRSPHHDWLLTPQPVTDDLRRAAEAWRRALAACGPETHPRLPLLATVRGVARSQGWGAVVRAARNRLRKVVRTGA